MGYFPEKVRNKDISQNEYHKNNSAKTDAMEKIMELYRSKLTSWKFLKISLTLIFLIYIKIIPKLFYFYFYQRRFIKK